MIKFNKIFILNDEIAKKKKLKKFSNLKDKIRIFFSLSTKREKKPK